MPCPNTEAMQVLDTHLSRYPLLTVRDAVKLLYQREFGGGHLIRDEAASLARLKEEAAALADSAASASFFEDIGNGLCRLHLAGLDRTGIALQTVNRMFVRTAEQTDGQMARFCADLEQLRLRVAEGDLPFPKEETESFLNSYREQGYPAVSHSPDYRAAYAPAYRVVSAAYRTFFPVGCAVDRTLRNQPAKRPLLLAIEGPCGSGKSTLADRMEGIYRDGIGVFHMDDFFLRPEQRIPERLSEAGGNVDYERFRDEVTGPLLRGKPFFYRPFDCTTQTFSDAVPYAPAPLVVVEGVYSMHPEIGLPYDIRVFLDLSEEERRRRVRQRSGEALYRRFLTEWIPMEDRYFEKMHIRAQCDLVLSTG